MDTEQLATALRGATADLEPRPSLTEDVVAGGKRRLRRRRVVVTVVSVATAVAVAVSSVVGLRLATRSLDTATDPRLSVPTRGDLHDDHDFIDWALRVWPERARIARGTSIGQPHVYWAGHLAPGKVAVLIEPLADDHVLFGVIVYQPNDNPPVGATSVKGTRKAGGFRIGDFGDTVVAVPADEPLYLSPRVEYGPGHTARRDWQRMREVDGLAVAESLPHPSDPRLSDVEPGTTFDFEHEIVPAVGSAALEAQDRFDGRGPDWTPSGETWAPWAGSPPAAGHDARWAADIFVPAVARSGRIDPASSFPAKDAATWFGLFGLSDGRTAIVSEYEPGYAGLATSFAVVVNGAGDVERVMEGALPINGSTRTVVIPLGDDFAGPWAVVAKGCTLSYRTGADQPWLGMRQDALLVPADATSIRSELPDAPPQIIDVR
ncbi:hypothetical protein GCM10029964_108030 [Kibdelosporangium lantanae]